MTPPVVVTIAGFDPSSGAGVTADIKTIAAHHCYGAACITALTVQSTAGVRLVRTVDPELVTKTLQELAADLPVAAVRIGMLGSGAVAEAVADFLAQVAPPQVVLDPILSSTSGWPLLDEAGVAVLRSRLLPLATLVTPNIDEASALTGDAVTNVAEMRAAAARMHAMGARNVVVTGGHLDQPIDVLSLTSPGSIAQEDLRLERVRSKSTHGTGCAFATAVTCNLAQGRGVREAVLLAKAYVAQAIAKAYPLGQGTGPVNHLYRLDELQAEIKTGGEFEHPRERGFREGV